MARDRDALGPTTFLLRNRDKSLPLVGVIVLAVMLVAGIISLIDSIPYSIRTIYRYSDAMLGVTPRGDASQTPRLIARIRRSSPVPIERVAVCRAMGSQVRSIVGKWPFAVLALSPSDTEYYLRRQGVTALRGRAPRVGEPEAIVSEPVARNLNLKIGSTLLGPDLDESYSPKRVRVVGIARSQRWLMIADLEYQRRYHFPPVDLALVFARDPARQPELDRWAIGFLKGERVQLFAYDQIRKNTDEMFVTLYAILNVVIGLLVAVVTLMVALLINIHQGQRMVEFGLLQAIGHSRRRLVTRALAEAAVVVTLGWTLGVVVSRGLLTLVDAALMNPKAFVMNVNDPIALLYTVPLPVAILVVSFVSISRRFRTFDPVAIVERRLA